MAYILNFNVSRDPLDLIYFYNRYRGTNINFLIDDFPSGKTGWSVPRKATIGDTVFFMCAKEARKNLGMALTHLPNVTEDDFWTFVESQKDLYKQYSGHILAYGTVVSLPEQDGDWWMSDIDPLVPFSTPVSIDEFRSFIFLSRRNSITRLSDEQTDRLKWVINSLNPGVFPNVASPSQDVLDKEFENAVRIEMTKSLQQLKKEAVKRSSHSYVRTAQTKLYKRDPVIAAYVKRRANGCCQLCGLPAPFCDANGDPYLECHHIDWLSKGGEDSVDNCAALCPNCHRKMHILDDPEDRKRLKASLNN